MPYIYKSGQQFGMGNITINTPTRELTQAQYEALPASEKTNGTIYFITDTSSDKIVVNDSAPIGAIIAYGGSTAPGGWLLCEGQAVSRTTYSELFAAIGTSYGSGNGSTTFNVPDLRGRVTMGVGTLNSNTYTLGEQKDAGLPNITGKVSPAHSSGVCWYNVAGASGAFYTSDSVTNCGNPSLASNFTGDHNLNIDASRSSSVYGNSTTVQPPATVTNYIIKAKDQAFSNSSILTMVDFFYPVGSYYETSDSTFNPNISFGGTWSIETQESNAVLTQNASMSASATGTYSTGPMITLQPNTHYLLFGYGAISVGGNYQTYSSFYVSTGTPTKIHSFSNQPYAGAGNGHNFQAYVETGDTSVGIGVTTYHYDTGYTKTWSIAAIPIPQYAANCYRWHRTA